MADSSSEDLAIASQQLDSKFEGYDLAVVNHK